MSPDHDRVQATKLYAARINIESSALKIRSAYISISGELVHEFDVSLVRQDVLAA
jgi:hypothetical protein